MAEKGIPVQALKFIPGFGDQVHKLLYGDPYAAHTYFADMLYHVQQLLDQDSDFDPVEVTRRQEFAEAEKRANQRAQSEQQRTADFGRVASSDTTTSGTLDGFRPYGEWKEHTFRPASFPLHDVVSEQSSLDSGQQTEVQSAMEHGRSTSEQAL